ncbi:MAG: hypothetical protein HUJ31_03490, partial [Pseudomonadales bacterium]|nr:hypothetical protein [Pseudomonadales bacterium]
FADGTDVMLQMTLTKQNAPCLEEFVEEVKDWPVTGLAFTFYVPDRNEVSELAWDDLLERDLVLERLIRLKQRYPIIKTNVGALELMMSENCLGVTGENGENCTMKHMLPLYVGEGGSFERTFCCYGNNVDCARCGAYAPFNAAWHRAEGRAHTAARVIDPMA